MFVALCLTLLAPSRSTLRRMASNANANASKRPQRIISEAGRKKREEDRLRIRQIAYRLNPPRWTLQWWKNRAVKWLRTPYDLPPILFWRVFWWIFRSKTAGLRQPTSLRI